MRLSFQDRFWLLHIPFVRVVKLKVLHNSLWITLSTQSCLILYSFCAILPHSLIIWLIVLTLTPHNLHYLFCSVLTFLALTVLMALFCAVISRGSVSLLRDPFFRHVQIFWCEILLVCRLKLFFFVFLLPSSCCSVDSCGVCVVYDRCK